MDRRIVALAAAAALVAAVAFARAPVPGPQQPARDTPAQQAATPAPSSVLAGRVLAADSGRPVKRARVMMTAAELPGGRAAQTDDSGAFEITGLPAGRYTVTVSKSGFIALSYGQRRPLQPGTPIQLGDGQQLKGVDFRLPRGGAIGGRVFDEDGEPMPGVSVRVMSYQYLQGDRRLVPIGAAQTDDRGQYRVWGLNPGDYYVSATARAFDGRGRGDFGGPGGGITAGLAGNITALLGPGGGDDEPVGYAPTYYPGVPWVGDARPITLGVSEESLNVDFGLQLVRTAKISGRVTNADGSPSTSGNVTLIPDGGTGGRGAMGTNYATRIQWDGAFSLLNVPPGRYTLTARGNDADTPQFASQPFTVTGGDTANIIVVLSRGGTMTGSVTFVATQAATPSDPTQIRITAPSADSSVGPGQQANARAEKDGTFTLDGISTGPHFIRANGAPRGWALKAVMLDGRDVVDTPVDFRANQKVSGVSVVFTDKLTQITGLLATDNGVPVTELTVLAFPTDPSLWRPQSRQIMTARPDQTGQYRIRGLPPGEYYLAAVDPAVPGEWFEPAFLDAQRQNASRLTLAEGDAKTHDFKLSAR